MQAPAFRAVQRSIKTRTWKALSSASFRMPSCKHARKKGPVKQGEQRSASDQRVRSRGPPPAPEESSEPSALPSPAAGPTEAATRCRNMLPENAAAWGIEKTRALSLSQSRKMRLRALAHSGRSVCVSGSYSGAMGCTTAGEQGSGEGASARGATAAGHGDPRACGRVGAVPRLPASLQQKKNQKYGEFPPTRPPPNHPSASSVQQHPSSP